MIPFITGDSWMYPYQRTPMGNPYISPIYPYIVGVYGLLSPRIPVVICFHRFARVPFTVWLSPLSETMTDVKYEMCGGNRTFIVAFNPDTQCLGAKCFSGLAGPLLVIGECTKLI